MQCILCDCSTRVTVVLGVRQPQLLSRKFVTACCPRQKGCGRQLVSFLIHQNEAEDSRMKWLPPSCIYYLCCHAHLNNLFVALYLVLEVLYLCFSSTSRVAQVLQIILWHLCCLRKVLIGEINTLI